MAYVNGDGRVNGTLLTSDTVPAALATVHTACIMLILVVNVAANGMVFVVFYRKPSLLTLSNRFVLNLSIANSLLTVLVLPFAFVSSFTREWTFGDAWCIVTGILTTLLFNASILTLLVIAVDRYFAVMRPLHYSMCVTARRVVLSLVAVWLCAAVGVLPPVLMPHLVTFRRHQCLCSVDWSASRIYAFVFVAVYFVVPFVTMLSIYVCIFRAAKLTSARARRNSSDVTLLQQVLGCGPATGATMTTAADRRRSSGSSLLLMRRRSSIGKNLFSVHKDDRKAARTGVVVMSTFVACWLPFFAVVVVDASLPFAGLRMCNWLRALAVWVALCGCALNPLVYVFRSRPIKCECRRLMLCVFCGDRPAGDRRRSTLHQVDTSASISVPNVPSSTLLTPNTSATSLGTSDRLPVTNDSLTDSPSERQIFLSTAVSFDIKTKSVT